MDLQASASSRGVHIMCTMWNLDICHVYTVKLFHSCCQLHLQDRVQANKVFHTRLVLTVHWLWLLCRSVIGSLSPTWGKTGVSPYLRPWGLNIYYIFQNVHIFVNQLALHSHRKLHVFLREHIQARKRCSLLHGAARGQKAVIYHNYASGPISLDPLAVILECAVVLSAFNVEREMGCACQEL